MVWSLGSGESRVYGLGFSVPGGFGNLIFAGLRAQGLVSKSTCFAHFCVNVFYLSLWLYEGNKDRRKLLLTLLGAFSVFKTFVCQKSHAQTSCGTLSGHFCAFSLNGLRLVSQGASVVYSPAFNPQPSTLNPKP